MDIHIDEEKQAILDKYASSGLNCCQKTCLTFEKEFPLEHDELMRVAAPFGGGMGYFGLTCGTLAGAAIVFANHFADGLENDPEYKPHFYAALKEMCEAYEARAGATTCAALKKMQAAGLGPSCGELEKIGITVAEEFIRKYQDKLPDRLAKK